MEALAASPPIPIGSSLLGRYRLSRFEGLSPIGATYMGWDMLRSTVCCVELLPKQAQQNQDALRRLEASSALMAGLTHPNLARHLDFHRSPEGAFLVEEWVDGPPLGLILEKAPLGMPEVLAFLKAMSAALSFLHGNGRIHLNVTPEMIRLDRAGRIVLMGVGACTAEGDLPIVGASAFLPLHLAPEICEGGPAARAADTYALAVLAYRMLTAGWITGGEPPSSTADVMQAHLTAEPVPPLTLNAAIPDAFSRLMTWALRKNPADRLAGPRELYTALLLAAGISDAEIPPAVEASGSPVAYAAVATWSFLPSVSLPPRTREETASKRRFRSPAATGPHAVRRRGWQGSLLWALLVVAALFGLSRVQPTEAPAATPLAQSPPAAAVEAPFLPSATSAPAVQASRRIVFTCTRGDFNQLCMVNFDGTDVQRISNLEASDYYPVFSPAADGIVFASNRNGQFDLYWLAFSDRQLVQLTDRIGNVFSPDFSPDGQKVVFLNKIGDEPAAIWIVNRDGFNPHVVYAGLRSVVAVAWSPDGSQLALAMSIGLPTEFEIFVMDAGGGSPRRVSMDLLGIGGSVSWSPDSRSVLVSAGPVGDKDIYLLDVASGEALRLTEGGDNAAAAYSPDGQYVVFNSLRNDGQADLYLMNADGSQLRRLTDDPEPDWGARWEP